MTPAEYERELTAQAHAAAVALAEAAVHCRMLRALADNASAAMGPRATALILDSLVGDPDKHGPLVTAAGSLDFVKRDMAAVRHMLGGAA